MIVAAPDSKSQMSRHGTKFIRMIRPSFPLILVVAQAETTLLTQIMLPIAPPTF